MSDVDERIVRMQFDNSNFEAGATKATGILQKLDEALKFKNGSDGLNAIQKSSNSFNMNGIEASISIVSERFSAFQEFVSGIFRRLGERVADFGIDLTKKITLKPAIDGFSEYELQMKSIQTISANTGLEGTKGIAKINSALDELNVYADKTIYNFSEMTRNIGTFTAAGVDLETSTNAIKGIANLAAVSGSTSQQASTAMYQLSQALASGTVKLQDWNSVVNAGMGGKVFQEALKRTARAHGIAVDEMIEDAGSFRESLKEGWITSEVLTDTLNQLAISYNEVGDEAYKAAYKELRHSGYSKKDAKEILRLAKTAEEAATMVRTWTQLWDTVGEALSSGWAESFRLIVGDFNQATELFTWLSKNISSLVEQSSNARNKILKQWGKEGGRDAFVGSVANLFTAVTKPLLAIADSFDAVFGISGKELAIITEDFANFTEGLVLTDDQANYLAGTFDIIFSLLSDGISVVSSVTGYFGSMADSLFEIQNKANAFRRIVKIIQNVSKAVYKPLHAIGTAFSEVFNFDDKFDSDAAGVLGRFLRILENLSKSLTISDETAAKLHDTFKAFFETVKGLFGPLENTGSKLLNFFTNLSSSIKDSGFIDGIVNSISEIDWGKIFDKIKAGAGAGLLVFLGKWIKDVLDKIGELKEGFTPFSGISNLLDNVGDSLESWQKNLKVSTLLKIAAAIGIIAASMWVLSRIPSEQVISTIELFGSAIVGLLGAFAGFSKFGSGGKIGPAIALIFVAGAILILSTALNKLKDLNLEQLGRGLGAIGGLLLELMFSLNNMPDSGRILSSAAAMLIMSIAIGALSVSMKLLSTISWEDIGKGLLAIAGLLLEFTIAFNNMPDSGRILSSAAAMLIMSVAIGALSVSMKLLSTISWEDIGKGLLAIAGLLLEFMIAFNNMPDSGRILSSAAAMLIMSVAIGALSVSMKLLATISWEDIGKGLLAIAGMLVELGLALQVFNANIGGAAAMLIVAASIAVLAVSMKLLATISWEDIGKSLVAIAGLLVELGIALAVFQANIGGAAAMLVASVAMVVMAAAVNLLVPALVALSNLSLEQIGTALLALGGAFLILGGAAAIISVIAAPTLMFALSMLALGAAAYLAAKAIETLISALTPILPSMIEVGGNLVNGLVKGVSELGSHVVEQASKLGQAFLDGVKNFFGIHSPSTVMSGIGNNIVQGLINGIGDFIGSLGTKALEIGSTILNSVAGLPGTLLGKGSEAVSGFISGAGSVIGGVAEKGSELASGLVDGARNLAGDLKDKASSGVSGFIQGASAKLKDVTSKSKELSTKMLGGLSSLKSKLKQKASDGVSGFVSGVSSKMSSVKSAASNLAKTAVNGVGSLYSKFRSIGKDAGSGFTSGIGSMISSAASKAAELAKAAADAAKQKLKINSPSKVFREIGSGAGEGFIQGIDRGTSGVVGASKSLAGSVIDSFADALSMAAMSSDDLLDFDDPVITPVLDTSDIDYSIDRLRASIGMGFNDLSIGNLNYTGELSAKISDYNDLNKQTLDAIANNQLDYNLLGAAVANALIRSGVHVEMDGGQLMGYLAGEISDARRMYG